jgi:8-oxo-dGTP pyrophosphatase MutT (NUDIX family)
MRTIKRDIVGAFIISADKKILLGKSNRATYEGMWIVPGGGIEAGESAEEALYREVLEETGINISNAKVEALTLRHTGTSEKILKETGERVIGEYDFFNYKVTLAVSAKVAHVQEADDFTDATWWSFDELGLIPLSPPTKRTLEFMGVL